LLDYYSQSLAQFKASFRISLFFASLGAFILLSGVALAVFRAGGNGSQYAAVTSTVAGTVASLLSGVLFVYSSRAIKHLDSQAMRLREDRDRERSFERNCTLLDRIKSESLRDQVTANIIIGRSLESAKNADRSAKDPLSSRKSARRTRNGKADIQSVRKTTDTPAEPTSQRVSTPDPGDSI
jgi:membrane protein implicated in regulation of membrane protease activity